MGHRFAHCWKEMGEIKDSSLELELYPICDVLERKLPFLIQNAFFPSFLPPSRQDFILSQGMIPHPRFLSIC